MNYYKLKVICFLEEEARINYGRLHGPKKWSNTLKVKLRGLWTFPKNIAI